MTSDVKHDIEMKGAFDWHTKLKLVSDFADNSHSIVQAKPIRNWFYLFIHLIFGFVCQSNAPDMYVTKREIWTRVASVNIPSVSDVNHDLPECRIQLRKNSCIIRCL